MSDTPTDSTPPTGAEPHPQPIAVQFPLPPVDHVPAELPHTRSAYRHAIIERLRCQFGLVTPDAE